MQINLYTYKYNLARIEKNPQKVSEKNIDMLYNDNMQ